MSWEKFLKFYVDKDMIRNSLSLQLTNIGGDDIPKLNDSKTYNFSVTRIRKKRKRKMAQPIETVIACVQQNFEIAGGLNPVQIEIEDGGFLNIFKKT